MEYDKEYYCSISPKWNYLSNNTDLILNLAMINFSSIKFDYSEFGKL